MIQQVGNVSWKQIKKNTYSYRISSKWINILVSSIAMFDMITSRDIFGMNTNMVFK